MYSLPQHHCLMLRWGAAPRLPAHGLPLQRKAPAMPWVLVLPALLHMLWWITGHPDPSLLLLLHWSHGKRQLGLARARYCCRRALHRL